MRGVLDAGGLGTRLAPCYWLRLAISSSLNYNVFMIKHKHLIIRAEIKKPFTQCGETAQWLCELVKEIGMNITEHGGPHVDYVDKEGNCGIAGVVMIETSHISIHVWDKEDPPLLQMDVYSCADFNEDKVVAFLSEMEPISIDYMLIDRKDNLEVSDETIHHLLGTESISHLHPLAPQIDPLGLTR